MTTFLLGLTHGTFAVVQFHALGNVSPLVSLFVSKRRFDSLPEFPFQALGFFALVILFLMAATSHDFWLRNLTAPVWKCLHMLVYVAYGLLIAHVTLGALQSERSPVFATTLAGGEPEDDLDAQQRKRLRVRIKAPQLEGVLSES